MDGNNQANQSSQPGAAEQLMSEMENERLLEEQQAQMAAATAQLDVKEAKKENKGLMIGLIVAIVVAVCGIGFGVLMTVLRTTDAADYDGQIATLTKTNSMLTDQLQEVQAKESELDAEGALKVLQEQLEDGGQYVVEYARIDNWYEDEDGELVYEVAYVARDVAGTLIEDTALVALDETGAWGIVNEYMSVEEGTAGEDVIMEEVIPGE